MWDRNNLPAPKERGLGKVLVDCLSVTRHDGAVITITVTMTTPTAALVGSV